MFFNQAALMCLASTALPMISSQPHSTARGGHRQHIIERLREQDYSNDSPLIGILTEPEEDKSVAYSTIAGPIVSWIESQGGRAVPIRFDAPWEEMEKTFNMINGAILPGGSAELNYGNAFFDAAANLLKLAKKSNDEGNIFPVFGLCLGFETMNIVLSGQTKDHILFDAKDQESMSNTIQPTENAKNSLFFHNWPTYLQQQASDIKYLPTFNAHVSMVPVSLYKQYPNSKLANALQVLTTSIDGAGKEYVSTVEAYDYPFFATQYHPEKPAVEFQDKTVPHTRTAIEIGTQTAQLLVEIAKLNRNKVSYDKQVAMSVNNLDRHYLPAETKFDPEAPLPDIMFHVGPTNNARKGESNHPYYYQDEDIVDEISSIYQMLLMGYLNHQ